MYSFKYKKKKKKLFCVKQNYTIKMIGIICILALGILKGIIDATKD